MGEQTQIKWYSNMKEAAMLFIGMVWLPLTVKNGLLIRRNFEKNGHLRFRIIGLTLISFPMLSYGSYRYEKHGLEAC